MPTTPKPPARERFDRLLGKPVTGYGTVMRLARALGLSHEHVSRTLNGDAIPEAWEAVAELLEALPRDQWPVRWR